MRNTFTPAPRERPQALDAYDAATGGTLTPIAGIKGVVATKSNADSDSTIG